MIPKTLQDYTSGIRKLSARSLRVVGLATTLLSISVQAQVIEHVWSASGDGRWEEAANWTPAPTLGVIGSNAATALDRVTIQGPQTVTRRGSVAFVGLDKEGSKIGELVAVNLGGGATLNIQGDLRVLSASGSPRTIRRNVRIDSGSTLNVRGGITTGVQNSSGLVSVWDIQGAVNAASFSGHQSTNTNGAPRLNGGYLLKVNGGSLTITGEFDWRLASAQSERKDLVGQIQISSGGTVSVGVMNPEWTFSSQHYVVFTDATGSLTFGKTHWPTESDVSGLIERGFIRKDRTVRGDFVITNLGDSWKITAGDR